VRKIGNSAFFGGELADVTLARRRVHRFVFTSQTIRDNTRHDQPRLLTIDTNQNVIDRSSHGNHGIIIGAKLVSKGTGE
jgi:hypothetical protein